MAQVATGRFVPGVPLLAASTLLLLVTGYDNRVEFSKFDPGAEWQRVEPERLFDLERLHGAIRRWDMSTLDVTNPAGLVVFLLVLGGIVAVAVLGSPPARILALDAAILLLPHWLTGIRRVLLLPGLLVKVKHVRAVLDHERRSLGEHRVDVLMLMRSGSSTIPGDVKIKITPDGAPPEFLGLYGQVVLNEVQGRSYPYFYTVLVARRGFGMAGKLPSSGLADSMVVEHSGQDGVEVVVLRQRTTKRSGYHTDVAASIGILRAGIRLAERLAANGGS